MTDNWQDGPDAHDGYFKDKFLETAEERALRELATTGRCIGRALDVGCGDPSRGIRILTGAAGVESVDLHSHKLYPGVRYADAVSLPFPDESFDTVLACRVLSNCPYPLQALCEARRVLRAGGRLLLSDIWQEPREDVQRARQAFGFPPLPSAGNSAGALTRTVQDAIEQDWRGDGYALKADYVIWTRVKQWRLLSYTSMARYVVPQYTNDARRRFGFYRVHNLRKHTR